MKGLIKLSGIDGKVRFCGQLACFLLYFLLSKRLLEQVTCYVYNSNQGGKGSIVKMKQIYKYNNNKTAAK